MRPSFNPALAAQFMAELSDSVEVLSDIADTHGVRTLTDLMYLQNAILTCGYIDAWLAESMVLDVIRNLPSAATWESYCKVYDDDGACISDLKGH